MSAKNRYLGKLTAEQQQQQEEKKIAEGKLYQSLKRHILRERDRRKQLEAETAKEEQLRNEREARKKQDKRTLGKTQQEIKEVEDQLVQLKDKKHSLFLQLKALITKEDLEIEKFRKENDIAMNARPEAGPIYGSMDKAGMKRGRSPDRPPADYYKNANQSPNNYIQSKQIDTGRHENRGRAVLWSNPAKYGQSVHQAWPMTNHIPTSRYPLPQNVPQHILTLNEPPNTARLIKDSQGITLPPPTQKTGSISIEKINEPMRAKIPAPQQDFTIHRRIGIVNPPGQGQPPNQQQPEFPNPPFNLLRYE